MIESIFKETGWNFPNLRKDVHTQIHEVQRPRKSDPKKIMPGHIVIKLLNIKKKKRILKAVREKRLITYKEWALLTPRKSAYVSEETRQNRRE